MKLFGGKKGDEKAPVQGGEDEAGYYDSPVETVSLSGSRGSASVGGHSTAQPASGNSNKVVVDQHEDEPRPHYGIEQAITLMRALPMDQNPALVVAVFFTNLGPERLASVNGMMSWPMT